jgi:PKD repeat protein
MNLFTQGQVSRIETVLQNSPRRQELLTSNAADPLDIYASFTVDEEVGCAPLSVTFTDQSGVADSEPAISSWTWNFDVTGVGGTLTPSSTASGAGPHTITFDPTALGAGTYTYEVELVVSNGSKSASFKKNIKVIVPAAPAPLPLVEDFESGSITAGNGTVGNWQVSTNSNGGWAFTSTAYQGVQALWVDNYNLDLRGKKVEVLSPYFSLVGTSKPQLRFYVAYAPYSTNFYDGLEVVLLTDCGATETVVYSKENQQLATAPATTLLFTPTYSQWREEIIDLSAHIGQTDLRIAIRNKGGYGNALYIDGLKLYDAQLNADISLSANRGRVPFTVTISDASSVETGHPPINSWNWDFNAAALQGVVVNPYATSSTQGPHTITYEMQNNNAGLYTVQVRLTVSNGNYSDTKQVPLMLEVPLNVPQNLTVSSNGVPRVAISWTYPNNNGAEGFRVERSENGQNFVMVGATALNELSYTDRTVLLGRTYYYRVYAYNDTKGIQSDYTPVQEVRVSETVTGVEDELSAKVQLYPNPNNGTFTVTLPQAQNATLRVLNQLGQVVWHGTMAEKRQELLLELSRGVYFLQIQLKESVETMRLVIE